jgi:hypothetical protein
VFNRDGTRWTGLTFSYGGSLLYNGQTVYTTANYDRTPKGMYLPNSAATNTITATTDTTLLQTGVGTLTIAANEMVPGTTYRLKAYLKWYSGSTSTYAYFTVKLGSITLFSVSTPSYTGYTYTGLMDIQVHCVSTGTSGVITTIGNITLNSNQSNPSGIIVMPAMTNNQSYNTTTANSFDVVGRVGSSAGGSTINMYGLSIEKLTP